MRRRKKPRESPRPEKRSVRFAPRSSLGWLAAISPAVRVIDTAWPVQMVKTWFGEKEKEPERAEG